LKVSKLVAGPIRGTHALFFLQGPQLIFIVKLLRVKVDA
jgi:hypothetical protein